MKLTTFEVKNIITDRLKEYYKEVTAIVKLISFRVTVLGEVRQPGIKQIYNEKLTVLEAIALAGDLTEFGNRETVKIIRIVNDKPSIYLMDLTKKELLNNDLYYLLPNDVIYIEPLPTKQFGFANVSSTFQFVFSALTAVSTILVILIYSQNIKK